MIIALNNKSNLGKEEFTSYISKLEDISTNHQLILCPTFLNLGTCSLSNIDLGSQNVSRYDDGAYTGEVSASQLHSYGVRYAIVGHSERREYQRESLEEIHEKLVKLSEQGIIPILCVGESLQERKEGRVKEILKEEVLTALDNLSFDKIIIAYEPIWSIGTGVIPKKEEIEEVLSFLKELVPTASFLYGGSANEENIDLLKEILLIDGYLLGGLSLKPEKLSIFLQKLG